MARRNLIDRLPEIWSRLDRTDGVLKRYLGVWDAELNSIHDKITGLLRVRSVDELPDRWLPLLADLVGHRWRPDKTHDWNRRRIRNSIRRWSYKGTMECLGDLVAEHGGQDWSVTDMASRLWVWNRQGELSGGDSHLLASNFWHNGAFLLTLWEDVDIQAFLEDFEDIKPAGTVWFIDRGWRVPETVALTLYDSVYEIGVESSLETTRRYDVDLWLTFPGALHISTETESIQAGAAYGGLVTMDSIIRMDRTDITLDDGRPGNLLTTEIGVLQEPAELIEGII